MLFYNTNSNNNSNNNDKYYQQSLRPTMTVLCFGQKITTFQTCCSWAPACQVPRLISLHFKFLLTTSLHLRRVRPWFFAPELNWEYRSCLDSLSASMWWMWPVHLRFRSMSKSVFGARPFLLYISSFSTPFFHVIFIISLMCSNIYAFNFFTRVLYTVHVSAPYNRVEKIIALYTLYFTHIDLWWLSHSLSCSFPSAALAFPIRKVTSLSSMALSVMVPPRYTKFFVCTSASSCTRMSIGVCAILKFFTGWNGHSVFLIFIFKLNWSAADENLSTSCCMLSAS